MLGEEIHNTIAAVLKYDKIKLSVYAVSIISKNLGIVLSILNKYNNNNQIIQLIDEKVCYSKKQLRLAGILTIKSFNERKNISSKPQIEYLLYLTATTQIKDAIKKAGVKNEERVRLVIVTAEDINHESLLNKIRDEAGIMITHRKFAPDISVIKEMYGIDPDIPESLLESIILTKIAVLDTYK